MDINLERAAASSATRYKIAGHLREFGIVVEASEGGRPPTDGDFIEAIWDHLDTDPFVVIFSRGNDMLRIRVPILVLVWLKRHPEREYNILELDTVKGSNLGKSSTFSLRWQEDDGLVLSQSVDPKGYVYPVEFKVELSSSGD